METLRDARPLLDEQFDALAHGDRRRLLVALLGEHPRIDAPIDLTQADDTEALGGRVAMHHKHLPMLEDHGFIRWDREESRVTKGPQFENIEPLLGVLNEHRDVLPGGRL